MVFTKVNRSTRWQRLLTSMFLLICSCCVLYSPLVSSFVVSTSTRTIKDHSKQFTNQPARLGRKIISREAAATTTMSFENKLIADDERVRKENLKEELFGIADRTKRGFQASTTDRKQMNRIVHELSQLNPTKEPAMAYYNEMDTSGHNGNNQTISVEGKWTLIYTDAPDITSLEQNVLATLGRIGQECKPPYIKNVIEYTKPQWTNNIPFVPGTDESRILQKVVTKASASSIEPNKVKLLLSGLQIESNDNKVLSLLPRFVQGNNNNQIDISGPIDVPFGNFEILYLDDELRIIRTFQNYIAINVRQKPNGEWF